MPKQHPTATGASPDDRPCRYIQEGSCKFGATGLPPAELERRSKEAGKLPAAFAVFVPGATKEAAACCETTPAHLASGASTPVRGQPERPVTPVTPVRPVMPARRVLVD